MKVWFKHNKRLACYDTKQLETVEREQPEPLSGPFDECKDCPYCGHGFVCWCASGPCLREALRKVNRRKERMERNGNTVEPVTQTGVEYEVKPSEHPTIEQTMG